MGREVGDEGRESEVIQGKLGREVGEVRWNKGRRSSGIREEEIVDLRKNEVSGENCEGK